MYVIRAKSSKVEKAFDTLMSSLSLKVQTKIIKTISESPKSTMSQSSVMGRIEKKGKFWQYYVTAGDRIIYSVVNKTVLVLFAGNHNNAAIFLRTN